MNERLIHLGAFESTHIFGSGSDVIGTTRHSERWRDDLEMLLEAGITELRYPIPWHRIEHTRGVFDFSWIDGPMQFMQSHGMRPIIDPLHHTSFPNWLDDGFSNPRFPEFYLTFLEKVVDRYPWVDRCTIFNEPLATTVLCSVMGVWYPYQASDTAFARMAIQVSKTICLASRLVRNRIPEIEMVRVDTCEYHHPQDRKSEEWARFCNERRFLYDDLTAGRVNRFHPMYGYLLTNGVTADELLWFHDHPVEMDVCGLDYYAPSEMDWYFNSKSQSVCVGWPVSSPRGFASVACDYARKFGKPLMLTETNVRGTVSDRLTWLKHMEEQCEDLMRSGVELRGFCWFPSIDSTDWDRLCTICHFSVDPQGIWWLDADRRTRNTSELSVWYSRLARGLATASSLPAYQFIPPLTQDLAGHKRLMKGWGEWLCPEVRTLSVA